VIQALRAGANNRSLEIALRVAVAAAERVDPGCLARALQLTLLAPDIVEAILNGRQPTNLGLPRLMDPVPAGWSEQRRVLLNIAAVQ
jgi:hypothetical protein